MKVLLVGGACQNKGTYAVEMYGAFRIVTWGEDGYRLHHHVKRLLEAGKEPKASILETLSRSSDWVVICDEIGCGVVPMDSMERQWREETGRICCSLAEQADIVERITCGIPLRLKGERECILP